MLKKMRSFLLQLLIGHHADGGSYRNLPVRNSVLVGVRSRSVRRDRHKLHLFARILRAAADLNLRSMNTHYISVLCRVADSHSGGYEEYYLLGNNAV
jgi:hypothetical protein